MSLSRKPASESSRPAFGTPEWLNSINKTLGVDGLKPATQPAARSFPSDSLQRDVRGSIGNLFQK